MEIVEWILLPYTFIFSTQQGNDKLVTEYTLLNVKTLSLK